jgi:hypothetical protein
MFDEHIRRSAGRLGVSPITFGHPLEDEVLAPFTNDEVARVVVLTGTAGDGKSHLCGRIWHALGGTAAEWASDDVYFQLSAERAGKPITLHVIRDLTALVDEDPSGRYASKAQLLEQLSDALFEPGSDVYLLAANDGQLIETWRKLGPTGARAHALFEARLMDDADPEPGDALCFFNLSAVSSATVLELSLEALLAHEGWSACYEDAEADGFFGTDCPIRRNYELLRDPLVRGRLHALFELCDYNELHTPIRRVLMLLANAILGHPRVKDRLLTAKDVREVVWANETHLASLYSNLFGANLGGTKRESLEIFDYLGRFGIGHETTNRIDNILIFGAEDENLRPYYNALVAADTFYGATDRFRAAQHAYMETPEATIGDRHVFLDMLVAQRRGLFFKVPDSWADELKLWRLTVFSGAGDYLADVAQPLRAGGRVGRHVVTALVNGLNRIFTGLLVASDRELLLATSLSFSGARVSQLLEDRIAVASRGRPEKVEVTLRRGFPHLDVHLPNGEMRSLRLNLTRYEFLMRVSEGALPGNFSRECYEDILSFKSTLLAAAARERDLEDDEPAELFFRLLSLDAAGNPIDDVVEVASV